MPTHRTHPSLVYTLPFVGLIALSVVWEITARVVSPLFLAGPGETLHALTLLLATNRTWTDMGTTVYTALIGFSGALIIGVPLGSIIGTYPQVHACVRVIIDFFRSIPPPALLPLFIITLGIGSSAKVGIVFFACVWIILITSAYGVLHAHPLRRQWAHTTHASSVRILTNIILYDALPSIVAGARTALSIALIVTIVAEMLIGANAGLGQSIFEAHSTYHTEYLYALILITGTVGYILNQLFMVIEKRTLHWI